MSLSFDSPAPGASNDPPVPETPPSPTEFQRLVGLAAQHAQLLAGLTELFITTGKDQIREKAAELGEAIKEAGPVIHRALRWWTIGEPPADPPAAASYFHWTYRRALAALTHAGVAADAHAPWEQARAFARTHVPPIDLEWLQVRLLAESQAATPTALPNAVADPMIDYQIEATEHWCDAAEMQSAVAPVPLTSIGASDPPGAVNIFQLESTVWSVRYENDEKVGHFSNRPDSVFKHLARLLAEPNRRFRALDFYPPPPGAARLPHMGRDASSDEQSMEKYKKELERLASEIKEADDALDTDTANRARAQFNPLSDHVENEMAARKKGHKNQCGTKLSPGKADQALVRRAGEGQGGDLEGVGCRTWQPTSTSTSITRAARAGTRRRLTLPLGMSSTLTRLSRINDNCAPGAQ